MTNTKKSASSKNKSASSRASKSTTSTASTPSFASCVLAASAAKSSASAPSLSTDASTESSHKSLNTQTKEFRNAVAEMFIKCIEDNAEEEQWHRGWTLTLLPPTNATNGNTYRGINRLYLTMLMMINGWNDYRFCTLSQARKKGWHIKKGSKSAKVEYWFPVQYLGDGTLKSLTWKEYEELKAQIEASGGDNDDLKIGVQARYFNVFNGTQIDGIPELPPVAVNHDIRPNVLITKMAEGLNVPITYDGGDSAFYNIKTDTIHLPKLEAFLSDYDYACTAAHELSHATGAPSRLNRPQSGAFGTEAYAEEELVAEMSASFLGIHFGTPTQTQDFGNHKAYIQSWVKAIRSDDKHTVLFKAIKEAEKAADYLEKAMNTAMASSASMASSEEDTKVITVDFTPAKSTASSDGTDAEADTDAVKIAK